MVNEAGDACGRESAASCGGAAGRANAGPASAAAQAETEGISPNEGTEGCGGGEGQAKAVAAEHCPARQVATALARRDACRVSKRAA